MTQYIAFACYKHIMYDKSEYITMEHVSFNATGPSDASHKARAYFERHDSEILTLQVMPLVMFLRNLNVKEL